MNFATTYNNAVFIVMLESNKHDSVLLNDTIENTKVCMHYLSLFVLPVLTWILYFHNLCA